MKQRPTLVEIGNHVEGTYIVKVDDLCNNGIMLDCARISDDYNRWQLDKPGEEYVRDAFVAMMDEHQAEALRDALTIHLRRFRASQREEEA
tara:strand:- start:1605 stop:1877 length:273 start_codon:yes stop_codon:yes gene_type:complete